MEHTISFDQLPEAVQNLSAKLDRIEELLFNQSITNAEKPEDELFSIQHTADFLNLTKQTIYGKVSKNEIPFMKRGNRLYFSKTDLMTYLKEGHRASISQLDQLAEEHINSNK